MKQSLNNALKEAMLLYAVTDRSWLGEKSLLEVTEEILKNGATFLQIREKDMEDSAFLSEAIALNALSQQYDVPFVVNDRVDIALASGADGVHVGQSDIVGRDVRQELGAGKILGISANTVETALAAQAAGADYIGVGAIFATATKGDAINVTNQVLQDICQAVSIPVVAIGGIGAGNIGQLAGTGIDGVAVVSALYAAADPGAATRGMKELSQQVVNSCG